MPRQCAQCQKVFVDSQAFCTDDGNALPPPRDDLPVTAAMTAQGGPDTSANARVEGPPTAIDPDDPLRPGATVGEYNVEAQIGEGGMGVIFAARHPIIGKRVALKVLNPEMAANNAIVQRFIQEARSVNQIGHRNIVDIFSFGRLPDGRHYFVMEFLDGMPFSKRIREPMQWQEAVNIWLQMSSAVEAAHKLGIVHRDLKPDNIFITSGPDGPFVKVLDFGIAKLLGESSVSKTGTGVPMGTPLYMSPEQTKGENVDHRTDLYAVGCILYETIVGESPFNAPTYVEVMTKQLMEPPPPLAARAQVNHGLEALVMALLAKDAASRPPSMDAVRSELIRLRDLAMRHDQPLFVRSKEIVPAPPVGKIGPNEPTKQWSPIEDAGFTVPEPRDSREREAIAELRAQGGKKKSPVLLVAVGALVVTGAVAAVGMSRNAKPVVEQPPVVIASKPVATDGKIKVISTESGVTLTVDGKPAGEGGPVLEVVAAPGRHEIKLTREGFLPYSNVVVVAAGETTDAVVKLTPVAVATPTPTPTPTHSSGGKKTAAKTVGTGKSEAAPKDKDSTINPFQ